MTNLSHLLKFSSDMVTARKRGNHGKYNYAKASKKFEEDQKTVETVGIKMLVSRLKRLMKEKKKSIK